MRKDMGIKKKTKSRGIKMRGYFIIIKLMYIQALNL